MDDIKEQDIVDLPDDEPIVENLSECCDSEIINYVYTRCGEHAEEI